MNASKHTPGPWTFQGNGYHWRNGEYQSDGTSETTGFCPFCAHGESAAECVANARLIAAAPELLEACKALTAIETSEPCSYCGRGNTTHGSRCPVSLAEAAIAKTEGGTE
jgi:hypothetical protein